MVGHGQGKPPAAEANISFDSQVHIRSHPMKNLVARFLKDESGATAIEYGLIAAGISLAIIAAVNSLGTSLSSKFSAISSSLK
jgi:pilus assembly protein Flp/PilA